MRAWLLMALAACTDEPAAPLLFGVDGEERAAGVLTCPIAGPANADGTHYLGWAVAYIPEIYVDSAVGCAGGSGKVAHLYLWTSQRGSSSDRAALNVGDEFSVEAAELPHTHRDDLALGGFLTHRPEVSSIVGQGIITAAGATLSGSFTATGYAADGSVVATYSSAFPAR